jgi:hypothetical protein
MDLDAWREHHRAGGSGAEWSLAWRGIGIAADSSARLMAAFPLDGAEPAVTAGVAGSSTDAAGGTDVSAAEAGLRTTGMGGMSTLERSQAASNVTLPDAMANRMYRNMKAPR